MRRFLVGSCGTGSLYVYAQMNTFATFTRTRHSNKKNMSGFYNAGGTSPWFVYFQTTPNDDCMKFVIEGHEFLANMMPEDSAIYKAEQRRMNPPKSEGKAPFVVSRLEAKKKNLAAVKLQRGEQESSPWSSASKKPLVDLPSEEPYIDEDGGGASHLEMQAENLPEELQSLKPKSSDDGESSSSSSSSSNGASSSSSSSVSDDEQSASTPANPKTPSIEQRVAPMTMTFNRDNGYLSPLANAILDGIPDLIEDVTIGHHFITVRRTQLDELKWKYYDDDIEGERLLKEEEEKKKAKKAGGGSNSTFNTVGGSSSSPTAPAVDDSLTDDRMTPFQVAEAMAEITNACALPAQLHSAANNSGSAALKPERVDYSAEAEEMLAVDGVDIEGESNKSCKTNTPEVDPESEEVFRANYSPERLKRVLPIAEAQLAWSELQLQVSAILTDHMYSRKPHVTPDAPHPHADTLPKPGDSEALLAIKELIAGTIRPLVQEDGGDLRLVRFELLDDAEADRVVRAAQSGSGINSSIKITADEEGSCARTELPASSSNANAVAADPDFQRGRLHIEMLGACKSCKSSKTTLKDMIERTLQHWVPEVAEVVEVNMAKKASALGRSQK